MNIIEMFNEFLDQLNTLGKICLFASVALVLIMIFIVIFTWRNTRKIKKNIAKMKLEQGDVLSNLVQVNSYLKYLCQAKEFELSNIQAKASEQPAPVKNPVITPEPPKPQVPLPAPQPMPVPEPDVQPAPETAPQIIPETQPEINAQEQPQTILE